MASQALAPLFGVAQMVLLATGLVELGQELERRQCFLHNLRKKSHCWSQFPFWVHLQCLKFQTGELFAAAAVVGVGVGVVVAAAAVGEGASQGEVFGICLVLHLSL